MLKFMFVGRRAPGTTRTAALRHLRTVHGPMVVCPPPDAGTMPRDYVQNHVIDGAYPGAADHAIERDLVTELWFDSIDEMRAALETPYYLANLKPDEPRFVDDASVAKMRVEPYLRRDGKGGHYKLFQFISRGFADDAMWEATRTVVADRVADCPGITRLVENLVQGPPGGGSPFVNIVLEAWFTMEEEAVAALHGFGALMTELGSARVDPKRCFAVAAQEYDRAHLIDLHQSRPRQAAEPIRAA